MVNSLTLVSPTEHKVLEDIYPPYILRASGIGWKSMEHKQLYKKTRVRIKAWKKTINKTEWRSREWHNESDSMKSE